MNKIWMKCQDCDLMVNVENLGLDQEDTAYCPRCGGVMKNDGFHDEEQLLIDKQDVDMSKEKTVKYTEGLEKVLNELIEISNLKYAPKINSYDIADLILDLEEFGENNNVIK